VPADTTYIVLRRDDSGYWTEISPVTASNPEAAIRKAVQTLNPADGSYVATPQRSWRPLTVTATTQTILKLEQPADQS
jgi:hypothetical protein